MTGRLYSRRSQRSQRCTCRHCLGRTRAAAACAGLLPLQIEKHVSELKRGSGQEAKASPKYKYLMTQLRDLLKVGEGHGLSGTLLTDSSEDGGRCWRGKRWKLFACVLAE